MNARILSLCLIASFVACAQGKDDKKKSSDDPTTGTDTEADTTSDTGSDTAIETGTDTGTDDDLASTPVLAYFGGYTSCGTGTHGDPNTIELKTFFDATSAALKKKLGVEPKYLIACYTLDYENAYYQISGDAEIHEKLIAGMENDFEDLLASVPHPKVLLVGHSYGGWTAMDIALKLPTTATLAGIVTLDPISHENCTVNDVLAAQIGGGGPLQGCLEAPTDFGEDGIKAIAGKTKEWLNYYQTQETLLHSGEIKPAKNFNRVYTGNGFFAKHNGFLFDEAIGKDILDLADHSYP